MDLSPTHDEGGRMKAKVLAAEMPAGRYYVGDPCYGVPTDRWMEWLEAADYLDEPKILLAELDGKPVIGVGTAYGDGEYPGSDGNRYPVDAGLIGAVPAELVKEEKPFGMELVIFQEAFEVRYEEENGTICLGALEIQTDPPEEDTCWNCGEEEHYCRCDEEEE
jgi:hypothetical protein